MQAKLVTKPFILAATLLGNRIFSQPVPQCLQGAGTEFTLMLSAASRQGK